MPDDMLEDSIAIAKKTLDEHDFETDGVEVSLTLFYSNNGLRDLFQIKKLDHSKYLFLNRSQEKLRSTWMRNGSPTGTFSSASHLVAIQCMNAIASFTSLSSQARSLSSFTRPPEEGNAL